VTHGRYRTSLVADPPASRYGQRYDVFDVVSGQRLWSRAFTQGSPWIYVDEPGNRLTLEYPLSADDAKAQLKGNPALKRAADDGKLRGGDAYVEVLDLSSGAVVGRLVVKTGEDTYRLRGIRTSGDLAAVGTREGQAVLYSISKGTRVGAAFGRPAALSSAAGLLCVYNGESLIEVYAVAPVERKASLQFGDDVRYIRFSDDGTRLVVVTADQVARVFDVKVLAGK
jgi:hypothetical protein